MPYNTAPPSGSSSTWARNTWPGWPEAAYNHIFNIYENGGYRQVFIGTDGQARSMPPAGSAFPQAWSNISSGQPAYYPNRDMTPGHSGLPSYNPPSQQNWPGGNVPYYDINYTPGMPNYGSQQSGGQQGSGFPWAALFQGASQLYSGYLNKRSSDQARREQQQNTQAALAQLSPEAIRQLVQMFYTQNYAMLNPAMQSAQRGVAAGAARTGLTGAGVTRQLQAGIPGQFANMALNTASQQGLGVAGQRAGIYSGAPVSTPYSFGNDLQGLMQMLGRYGILRNNQQQTTQPDRQNQWWISGPGYNDNEYR